MDVLFLKIVNMSIAASWLILAVILLRVVLKKAPKWINVLLWSIVAFRLICPFSFESELSLIPSTETINPEIMMDWTPEISTGISSIDKVVNPIITETFAPDPIASANPLQLLIPVLAGVWAIGIVLLLVYAAACYFRLQKKVGASLHLRDNIWICDDIQTPFILGAIQPRIYVPSGTDEAQFPYIIAHENAHLKHRDHLWKPLGYLVLAIHWFNPLVWIAYILLCRDIELACDEKVIRELNQSESISYSEALLSCSVNRRMVMVCPLAFGEVGVKERVKRVLNYKKPAFWIVVAAVISSVILAVCFLTNPIALGDYLVLTNRENAPKNALTYDIQLGNQTMSGEIYVEQWVDGACVQSAPVVMTQYVDNIDIAMSERRDGNTVVGIDVQIETNQYGGSLLTYFEHPETHHVIGWSFRGYELDEKKQLSPDQEVILAAMAFDMGNGVRVFDCETLISEPERLRNADYMIVVRAVFSSDPLGVTEHGDISPSVEILPLNDVIILSQKGYDLTWDDFNGFSYIETGSGLYIRVYEINDLFQLMIGGAGPDSEPMYIYLCLTDDTDTRIDIRDGSVTEFISEHDTHSTDSGAVIPMIMVNDTLYLDTGFENTDAHYDVMNGEITSSVHGNRKPTVNDQSNFGEGYAYQYGATEGTIEIYMDGKWRIFATEKVRQQLQFSETEVIHYPAHRTLYETTPIDQIESNYDNEEFVITKLHYENLDGEWVCEGYTYKYRLEITGRMSNAAKNSTYIVLSNTENITFEQTWKASGLSSNMADYFDPSVAVIVGNK